MKPATLTISAFLAFIAVAHLVRAIAGWPATVNYLVIPVGFSFVGFVVFGAMAWLLLKDGTRA